MNNSISLTQRKLFNLFIAFSQELLSYKDIFTIKLSTLLHELNTNNIKYLKDQIKQLMSTVVDFNLLDKDKKSIWIASSLLASVAFKNWICYFSFSPHLKQILLNPYMYTYLDRTIIKNIKRKNTLPIYELYEDYKNIWQTPYINLDKLKLLTWSETKYNEFKTYSHHILKPWIKETNQNIKTHQIKPKYKREQRRVVAVKLLIDKNQNASPDNSTNNQENPLTSFYRLDYQEQMLLLDKFKEQKINNTIFQSIYEKEGLDSLAARGLFVKFLNCLPG